MGVTQSYFEVRNGLLSGEISCVQMVREFISKANSSETNAVLELFNESALAKAQEVDEKIKNGNAGRLAGMVIGIKDNIAYKGHKTSAASKILEGFENIYNATVIERLLAEDAIIIARLNCDEFAMGSSNENSAYGVVKNPLNTDYVPGGSSGGSAAAVAEGLCMVALGSDTGGSIRQPASFCGNIGYKPTYGRVSRYGLFAYASSFDQIGPIANTIEDVALVMEVISGGDEYDSTCSQQPVETYIDTINEKKTYKIGYLDDCMRSQGLDPEVKTAIETKVEALKAAGHNVEPVSFPYLDYMVPNYYILTTAEASSNLSRYDGGHYGYRSENAKDIDSTYLLSRTEGFGEEVKRRIMLGTFVLSAGYFDAYYTKGLKVRRIIKEKTEELFKEFDLILLPTTPTTAFKIGENVDDPITMYLQDIFTVQANLAGVPAVSVPCGKHSNGLPMAMQLMANKFEDGKLMQAAKAVLEI